MTQRNHSKLRPYNLSQAKVGDVVLTQFPEERGQVVALSSKEVAFLWENDHFNSHRLDKEHCLFQPPLAWLGPDPVYAGDTLWIINELHPAYGMPYVPSHRNGDQLACTSPDCSLIYLHEDEIDRPNLWSLTKPEPKPRLININGFMVQEPVRNTLAKGTKYYVPNLTNEDYWCVYQWRNDESDNRWLIRGLAHLTKEAAISHAQALLSITQV